MTCKWLPPEGGGHFAFWGNPVAGSLFQFLVFLSKCWLMKSKGNYKVSFAKMYSKGKEMLAQQPETTYAAALEQVERLKKNSKVNQSSKKMKM